MHVRTHQERERRAWQPFDASPCAIARPPTTVAECRTSKRSSSEIHCLAEEASTENCGNSGNRGSAASPDKTLHGWRPRPYVREHPDDCRCKAALPARSSTPPASDRYLDRSQGRRGSAHDSVDRAQSCGRNLDHGEPVDDRYAPLVRSPSEHGSRRASCQPARWFPVEINVRSTGVYPLAAMVSW